jgi:hypothetical protein
MPKGLVGFAEGINPSDARTTSSGPGLIFKHFFLATMFAAENAGKPHITSVTNRAKTFRTRIKGAKHMQLATLRMGTLKAERNAMKDDVDPLSGIPLGYVGAAKILVDRSPGAGEPIRSLDWNPLAGIPLEYDEDDALTAEELGLVGANDAEPTILSFYAGKSFAAGRAAHNQYLVSRGKPPIPTGKK